MRFFKNKAVKHDREKRRRETETAMTGVVNNIDILLKGFGKKVLFGEDDSIVTESMKIHFKELTRATVKHAYSLDDLETDIIENNLAFLLSDVRMVGGSSIELVYELWQKGLVHCPVFFYSGSTISPTDIKCIEEMGGSFFIKPLQLSELKGIAAKVLESLYE